MTTVAGKCRGVPRDFTVFPSGKIAVAIGARTTGIGARECPSVKRPVDLFDMVDVC